MSIRRMEFPEPAQQAGRGVGVAGGRQELEPVERRPRLQALAARPDAASHRTPIKEKLTWFDLPGDQLLLDRRGVGCEASMFAGHRLSQRRWKRHVLLSKITQMPGDMTITRRVPSDSW